MKLELKNIEDFGLVSAIIDLEKEEMTVKSEQSTDTFAVTKAASAKGTFTKQFGKGAKWEEIKDEKPQPQEEKKSRGRPKKDDKKKPVAKKKSEGDKVKPTPKKNISIEDGKVEVTGLKVQGSGKKEDANKDKPEVLPFDIEETPNGEESLDMNAFETEPSAVEKKGEQIKKELEGKQEVKQSIAPVETKDPVGMTQFKTQAEALINQSKAIVVVESDSENEAAREIGKKLNVLRKDIDKRRKEINKPLEDNVKSNNAEAKKITTPIQGEIDRIKITVGTYETKKEEERQKKLKDAEEAQKKTEQLQAAETARVSRIKNSISKMESDLNTKVEKARKVETLNAFLKQLKGWIPTKDKYMEFLPDVEDVVKTLLEKIEARIPLISELEEAHKSGNTLKIAEISEQLGIVSEQEKIAETKKTEEVETDDFKARQELITLFTSIGVEDVATNVENIIRVYGSAQNALLHKDAIIASYQTTAEAKETADSLKSGGLKNQRIDFEFKITDKSQIPLEYLKVDEPAIRAAIKANRQALLDEDKDFTIAGVEIKQKLTTVFR